MKNHKKLDSPHKEKKKYVSPQLKKHGSVAKLTLKGGSTPDFSNSYAP
jgi:hypothetical protein